MIVVKTNNPRQLLSGINEAIKTNRIQTWDIDSDGDYYPVVQQWKGKAWLRPCPSDSEPNILRFGIVKPAKVQLSKAVYGVFHGRFAEMLLTHFDDDIEELFISSQLTKGVDVYSPATQDEQQS